MNLSSMAGENKLHIVLFPWLAFGHIIPYLELAKLIAEKGHRISFVCTPRNIDRLPKSPPHLAPLIKFVKLPLPQVDNLPQNAEATSDLPNDTVPYLKKAYDGLEEGLTCFLETSKPDWIIYDFAPYWLPPVAAKLGISRAYFSIYWASTFCFMASSLSAMLNGDDPRTEPEHFTVSPKWIPFPSNMVFHLHEAKKLLQFYDSKVSGASDQFRLGSTISGCEVFAIRSCKELEPDWLSLLGELFQKPLVPVGLLPPSVAASGDSGMDETWLTISKWLEKQKKGSVIYVAFGSETKLNQEELTELAHGLELSGSPFFWVLRKGYDDSVDELPDGFEERTKERGVVWTSWVPQLRILAHESVGGFLTHCGWSSVIEGLHFGRALIMLPIAIDQGLIARVFEEQKVGIEVPRNQEDGSFTRKSLAESLQLVMVEEKGQLYREKAKEMMKMFGDKKLHDGYIDNFVKYLENHRSAMKI